MRRLVTCLVTACVLHGLTASPATATLIVPADLAELTIASQVVVHGRVIETRTRLSDDRRRVETIVTLEALDYLKGDFGGVVQFLVPGGEFGRYRSLVVGAPTFSDGDEVVLFLNARGPSVPYVIGLSQGVFRVRDTGFGKEVAGSSLVRGLATKGGTSSAVPRSLDDLRKAIRSIVAGTPDRRLR